ncbi:unnamed protein product [Vicia faba]|uniref:Uncharacterized protein n=1 Tax=Vicia faba TaxID=3906 RepID=A0AAV1A5H6_VICFA|nr:unnamed protein product [Vicia faba]
MRIDKSMPAVYSSVKDDAGLMKCQIGGGSIRIRSLGICIGALLWWWRLHVSRGVVEGVGEGRVCFTTLRLFEGSIDFLWVPETFDEVNFGFGVLAILEVLETTGLWTDFLLACQLDWGLI